MQWISAYLLRLWSRVSYKWGLQFQLRYHHFVKATKTNIYSSLFSFIFIYPFIVFCYIFIYSLWKRMINTRLSYSCSSHLNISDNSNWSNILSYRSDTQMIFPKEPEFCVSGWYFLNMTSNGNSAAPGQTWRTISPWGVPQGPTQSIKYRPHQSLISYICRIKWTHAEVLLNESGWGQPCRCRCPGVSDPRASAPTGLTPIIMIVVCLPLGVFLQQA